MSFTTTHYDGDKDLVHRMSKVLSRRNANDPSKDEDISVTVEQSGTREAILSAEVAAAASNTLITFAAATTDAVSVYLEATQDMTVCTNDLSSGAPDDTISLLANTPVMWQTPDWDESSNPMGSADVTSLYVTNSGGADGILNIRVLIT